MDQKESDFTSGTTCKFVRALDINGKSIKISVDDLMKLVPGISLAFKSQSLPTDGINIVGNHDGSDSGYGWYNNTSTERNDYAPGGSAGIFIRFNSNVIPVTFFIITVNSSLYGQLWWRPDGGVCAKVNI